MNGTPSPVAAPRRPRVRAVTRPGLGASHRMPSADAFWDAMLGLPTHARFDPPGIAFIYAGPVRLFFSPGSVPATIYLDVPDVDLLHADLAERGVVFDAPPTLLHTDKDGQFGPAGEGYVRLSFATSRENIREGARRIDCLDCREARGHILALQARCEVTLLLSSRNRSSS